MKTKDLKNTVKNTNPKYLPEDEKSEQAILAMKREYFDLCLKIPELNIRINELEITIQTLSDRCETLKNERHEKMVRKDELENILCCDS